MHDSLINLSPSISKNSLQKIYHLTYVIYVSGVKHYQQRTLKLFAT